MPIIFYHVYHSSPILFIVSLLFFQIATGYLIEAISTNGSDTSEDDSTGRTALGQVTTVFDLSVTPARRKILSTTLGHV